MTDTLERFLQDLRFDLPPGLVERATAAAAAAEPGAVPSRRGFPRTGRDSDHRKPIGRRTELAAGIAAILLAAIVIGSFAYVRAVTHQRTVKPPITTPSPGSIPQPPTPTLTSPLGVSPSTPVILFGDFGQGSQLDGMTWDGRSGVVSQRGGGDSNPAGTLFVSFPNILDRSGHVVAQLTGGPYADQAVGQFFVGTWADDERHYCQVVPIFGGATDVPGTLQLTTPGGNPRDVARVGLQSAQENVLQATACSVLADRAVIVQAVPGSSANVAQDWEVQLSTGHILWTHDLRGSGVTRVVASRDGRSVAELQAGGTSTIFGADGSEAGHVNASVEGFSWDGSLAIVVGDQGHASVISWRDGTTVWTVPTDEGLAGFQPEPGGTSFAIRTLNSGIYVVASSGRVIGHVQVAGIMLGCLPKQCASSDFQQILPRILVGNVGWADYPEHTTDGGRHWQDVSPPTPANRTKGGSGNFFLDPGHAWVTQATSDAAHMPNATELVVFATADGGQTWSQVGGVPISGAATTSARIDFIDGQHGWLITDSGRTAYDRASQSMVSQPITRSVYATADGGLNWTLLVTAPEGNASTLGNLALSCMMSGLTFTSLKDGWLTWSSSCQIGASSKGGPIGPVGPATSEVAVTHDGGFTWQSVNLPSYPFANDFTCDVHPPVFTSNRGVLSVVCGGQSAPGVSAVYATSDGGRSWTLRKLPFFSQQVDFVDANNGWTFGGSGVSLYRTTDGGKSWVVVKTFAGEQNVDGFSFVDSKVGFALTSRHSADERSGFSTMWKTTDGGKTWLVFSSKPTGDNRCC
jgi:hypothetical protein